MSTPATFYDDNGVVRLQGSLVGGGGAQPHTQGIYQEFTMVGASTDLAWAYFSGDALLDLTAPAAPAIVTTGVYALNLQIGMFPGVHAGKTAYIIAVLDAAASQAPSAQLARDLGALGGGGDLEESITLVGYLTAGATIVVTAQQDIGVDQNCRLNATLQRIS